MRVAILGAGNLGTTLAVHLSRKGHEVVLWTVEEDVHRLVLTRRENPKYLPGVRLPDSISITMNGPEALQGADFALLTVPSDAVRTVVKALSPWLRKEALLVNFAKGLEPSSGLRLSQVILEELGGETPLSVVSGPSIAREILMENPTAVSISSSPINHAIKAKELLETPFFRLYPTEDMIGVEVGGAFKNVFAIAAGICDGLGLGTNTKAAIVTRGMEELVLLGKAFGASPETLYGLSGLGDLVVTSFSPLSRNRRFGEKIAQGKTPQEAQAEIGQVVEGIRATEVAKRVAEERKLKLPIVEGLHRIIFEGLEVQKAFGELLW